MQTSLSFTRRLVSSFWRLAWEEKIALLEASVLLVFAKVVIVLLPFAWYRHLLGRVSSNLEIAAKPSRKDLESVRWAVLVAAKRLPLSLVCLPRAMAAKWMLKRRRIRSKLYLGMKRGTKEALAAHAWLVVADEILLGEKDLPGHVPVVCFS